MRILTEKEEFNFMIITISLTLLNAGLALCYNNILWFVCSSIIPPMFLLVNTIDSVAKTIYETGVLTDLSNQSENVKEKIKQLTRKNFDEELYFLKQHVAELESEEQFIINKIEENEKLYKEIVLKKTKTLDQFNNQTTRPRRKSE